eukprot:116033-Amphidinium_carterae.1
MGHRDEVDQVPVFVAAVDVQTAQVYLEPKWLRSYIGLQEKPQQQQQQQQQQQDEFAQLTSATYAPHRAASAAMLVSGSP